MEPDLASLQKEARDSLFERRGPLDGAEDRVPNRPGLYAVFGVDDTWRDLGLGAPPDSRPLYLGKAEDSLSNPSYFSNYGLSAAHDADLTRWMRSRLELAAWPRPSNCAFSLGEIEAALLIELQPPLNLQGVLTPWTSKLKTARKILADEARAAGT